MDKNSTVIAIVDERFVRTHTHRQRETHSGDLYLSNAMNCIVQTKLTNENYDKRLFRISDNMKANRNSGSVAEVTYRPKYMHNL